MLETPSIPRYSPNGSNNASGADNQQERLVKLAYLAGIVDGEGWVGVAKVKRTDVNAGFILLPQIGIHMVGKDAIEHIAKTFEAVGLPSWYVHQPASSLWKVHGYTRVPSVCEALLPYLHIKRKQAELILEMARVRKLRSGRSSPTEVELEIRETICGLNMKGKNPQRLYA